MNTNRIYIYSPNVITKKLKWSSGKNSCPFTFLTTDIHELYPSVKYALSETDPNRFISGLIWFGIRLRLKSHRSRGPSQSKPIKKGETESVGTRMRPRRSRDR